MRNRGVWLVILLITLVFGIILVGCKEEPTDDNNKTNHISDPDITYNVTANGTANTETTTQLTFTFSAEVSGLTAENITITNGTGSATKGTLTGNGTSWSLNITNISAGTVKIKIVKTGIENSEKTVTVYKAVNSNIVPQTPVSISYASANPASVVISWNSVSEAIGYHVYRSSSQAGTYTKISSDIITTSYTDTSVNAGNTYWYKVAAYNNAGEGNKSDAKQSDKVPVVTLLTVGADITGDIIMETETQVDWYKFSAINGTTYKIQCADATNKPSGSFYSSVVKVSAFMSDGTTPITSIQNATNTWSYSPVTLSGVNGTIYLKVEAAYSPCLFSIGTYGIKVSQQ